MQRTNLICNRREIGQLYIKKGLLQGDSLSPTLFVIAMEPLSRMLNLKEDKLNIGSIHRNHLMFIDDIKILAGTEDSLEELCQLTKQCLNKMQLTINQNKSASNVNNPNTFGEKLDDIEGY